MKKQIILYSLLCTILLPKQVFANPNAASENAKLKIILAEQQLQTRIDKVFASTPQLAEIYHKIQNRELGQIQELSEYNDLLNSRELKILNNSPEMQDTMKEAMKGINIKVESVNTEIRAINEQTRQLENKFNDPNLLKNNKLSIKETKEKINLNNITSSELKKQLDSTMQSFNSLSQLYFTNTKQLNSLSELTPIQKPDTLTTDALLVSIVNLDQLIDTRINDMLFETLGIASGEETSGEYGLWIKGLKSYAKQSEYKLTPGYKVNQHGVTIGVDFIDDLFGISYSFITDHLSTNIPNTGEKINSHIANVYGLYKFTDNLFTDMQVKYGKNYINKSRNNLNLSNDISYAKTTGDTYGGKVELGYNYKLQKQINMIPSIGLSYDQLRINAYKEKGSGFNRSIEERTVDKTTALLGLKINSCFTINSYTFLPEIHAKVFRTLKANNDNTTITIVEGMSPLVTPSGNLPKTIYKIGGSSKITKSQALELALGYDLSISKKFYSHTGYLSVKMIF